MNNLDLVSAITSIQLKKAENLPIEKQLVILANLLGYEKMPVSIDQFLDDPYYLGSISKNLYPFWRKVLRDVFPTPIHTSTPILVFTGAIGTGKSTAVRFMFEYMKHRLDCLRNPYDTLGFVMGKNLKFSFFHKTGQLAQTDFIDVMDSWEELSPYFKECYENGRLGYIEQVCDSVRSNNNIGSDTICFNYSELNFIPYDRAHEKLDQGLKRWSSRFEMFINYFGLVVIDTSAQNDDSIADDFIANNPYGDKVRAIYTNRWLVREHLHYYGQKGWFKVYCGDAIRSPFIVSESNPITPEMDPDRVLEVPMECYADFKFDLVTALQDIGGISVSKTDRFIQQPEKIAKCYDLPCYHPDVVKFDFFDKTDKLIYRFGKTIDSIPSDKVIFIRLDNALTGDNQGLAIAYFNKWVYYDGINQKMKQPEIMIPLAVAINRPDGEESAIYKIEEFILDLNERFEIGCFTCDQYQSRQLLQSLTLNHIPNQYLSVDRSDESYVYLKNLMIQGLVHISNNLLLKKEIAQLKRIGNKIDHPSEGCFIGDTEVIVKSSTDEILFKSIYELLLNPTKYLVLTYDSLNNKFEFSNIKKIFQTKLVSKLIELEFESGIFYCTEDHLILTTDGYKCAKDLTYSDNIISLNIDN